MAELIQSNIGEITDIQPRIDDALNRHLITRKRPTISLNPFELVRLEDYEKIKTAYLGHKAVWENEGLDIEPLIRSIYILDGATEDNLPNYTNTDLFRIESMSEWKGQWIAEERSHGEIMVREMESRGFVDMPGVWLPTREQNLASGIHLKVETLADAICYVATQELLTREAHFHSSRLMDNYAKRNLRDIGADEGRHYQFYLSVLSAIVEVNPDMALIAMRNQHEKDNFSMPGKKGIKGYSKLALVIALSGVFDAITVLRAQKQTIDESGMLISCPTTDEGKSALEWANTLSDNSDKIWLDNQTKLDEFRFKTAQKIKSSQRPFILGHTVEIIGNQFTPIDN